jgi:hypothetical protein
MTIKIVRENAAKWGIDVNRIGKNCCVEIY